MKVCQEAQAEVHREMTNTNKMRDGDALFLSIEVYNGTNPEFEKWMNNIDQATHITGKNLQKGLMKKSDAVVRNRLSMMACGLMMPLSPSYIRTSHLCPPRAELERN